MNLENQEEDEAEEMDERKLMELLTMFNKEAGDRSQLEEEAMKEIFGGEDRVDDDLFGDDDEKDPEWEIENGDGLDIEDEDDGGSDVFPNGVDYMDEDKLDDDDDDRIIMSEWQ